MSDRADSVDRLDAGARKRSALVRIEKLLGIRIPSGQRGAIQLPSGRKAFLVFAKGHVRTYGTTYWFGIPRDADSTDLLVLLLGTEDFVVPVEELIAAEDQMTRSADGRLTPYVVRVGDIYEQRVPEADLVLSLAPFRQGYERLLSYGSFPAGD